MALISTTGPICPNVTDTPLDNRSRVSTVAGIGNIPLAWKGMLVYCEENGKTYKVTSLKPKENGPVIIENYYPATWVEFGSGGSSPSPTPSAIDAGDVTYSSSGTFSNGTVGKELQSLASDISGLLDDTHNLSGDIGTLRSLGTDYQQDLVGAINEVLAITDDKVAGIKVQGESSVLPMDNNGIVTIPAGGGGTGTITGATVGGNPVTENSGILQFDAYPTANTMQYSSSTNYDSGTIGKEVKDLNGSVNNLSTKVAELDKPSPTPSQSTTVVNLANYATSGSSFTYDVDNKYIYNTKDTTFYQYSEEDNNTTVYYGVFKVIGEDRYLMYSITNNTTFTYVNTYTELTLPENAKKEFALGSVAVVKRVNGEGENWKNGTVNLFCTKQNMPLRNRCRNINFNGSTAWRVLIKSEDGNTIFVYKAKSNGNYEWEINVPRSSTANFNLLDKYFDRPEASNVSFDDSVTHLSTQGSPVNNVQDAIEMIVSQVTGTTGRLTVSLQYSNTIGIANKKCKIVVYYQGVVYKPNTFPVDDEFTTDTNGNIILNLPLGSTYTITPIDIIDYITPEDISGIIDDNYITKSLIYNAISNNERILFVVNIKNVSPQVTVNNKKLYIDIYNPENLSEILTEKAYTCTLGNDGTPKLIQDYLGNTIATGSSLYLEIPKGTKIKAYLQTWDGTDSPVQEYIKSSDVIITANKNKDVITFYYSNVNYGLYLLLKDNTKEKGYSKNKILEVDSTNNRFTCNIGGYNYVIYKENSKVYRILEGTSEPEEWLSNTTEAEIMLGVGISSSQTNSIEAKDDSTIEQGFLTLDFFVPRVVQYERGALVNGTSMPLFDSNDGMYITRRLSEYNETIKSQISQNVINNYKITLYVNSNEFVIPGFIPSTVQFNQFIANYSNILIVTNIFSGTPITKPVSIATNTYIATCSSSRNSSTMTYVTSYDTNIDVMNGWIDIIQDHQFYIFYPFA